MLIALNDLRPELAEGAWVAPSATVAGNVTMGPDSSVWYGTVVRADSDRVSIGARTNLQDNSVVHVDEGIPAVIGDDVVVGHRAVIHGCTIGDGCLIGMGAVVMNGAVIGAESLVAAGALVLEGTEVPPRSVVMGSPAKVVRELDPEKAARFRVGAANYVKLKNLHAAGEILDGNRAE
ncbi:gamma carbonic anhydrase family protein [Enemella sp. A6]|uniref:gamma carbonic anhydrase family protein n=1 Tax=Enemella sp. A6 TaxID=3440152 RepID=UPI003EBC39EA